MNYEKFFSVQRSEFSVQNMVEIIPKPPTKIPKLQKILFYFSIALMIAAIFGYFVIEGSLQKALQTSQDLDETLAKARTPESQILEKEALDYKKKIKDFSMISDRHIYSSKFFSFLEKLTHPQVWFQKIDFVPKEGKVSLFGVAENFTVLGQQFLIFKEEKGINSLKLNQVSLTEGGKIKFDLEIFLSPEIFKF